MSFWTSGLYTKAIYDKLQEFGGSYSVVCESMDTGDTDFKNLSRFIANCEGSTLYLRFVSGRKDQRKSQTILT